MEKITLFLMSYKGFTTLDCILQNGYKGLISKIIYAEDKEVVSDYSDRIITLCKNNNIPYSLKKKENKIETKILIAISWRWIIKVEKDQKLIVLHDSLLPKYRGFSPLVTALLNKDREIGVTALYASEEYDKGAIIKQEKTIINYPIKIESAIEEIAKCYEKLILFLCHSINNGIKMDSIKQNEDDASYSLWRDENDYEINWEWSANYIKLFVDAVGFPYNGASTYLDSKKIRIIDVEVIDDLNIVNRVNGKVIFVDRGKPVIVCGKGLIKILSAKTDDSNQNALPFKKFRTKIG